MVGVGVGVGVGVAVGVGVGVGVGVKVLTVDPEPLEPGVDALVVGGFGFGVVCIPGTYTAACTATTGALA